MKKHFYILALFATAACATVVGEHDQLITIATTPAGANCIASNSEGSWNVPQTPNTIVVPRSFEPLGIACSLAGHTNVSMTLEAKTRPLAYGNIPLLGFPAFIDDRTGAGYEYSPDSVMLEFKN